MTPLLTPKLRDEESPLHTYLREINQTRLLSKEEERELAYRVQAGDAEARDHLVRANLRLVVNIARSCQGRGLGLADLIAEGNLGLLRAAEGFDPSRNLRFSTYASYWVKQSIRRAVINTGKTIRVPAHAVGLMARWRRASAELREELGRAPVAEEVGKRLKLPKKNLGILTNAIRVANAVSHGDRGDSGVSLEELFVDGNSATPGAAMSAGEERRRVLHLLEQMGPRESLLLRLRYGLDGEEPQTLREVGERLGLTRERVRQIEREVLSALRQRMG